jgi:uncharacterized protein (DUF362 family)
MIQERRVTAFRDPTLVYPQQSPFDPDCPFPEYPFACAHVEAGNRVYGAVREVLRLAGLDAARFGTPEWNPLRDLVGVGGTVLIKPNWVRHYHLLGQDLFSIITHPAVLRPLIDFAFKAVGPTGRIWVMDAPQYDTDFSKLWDACQLGHLESTLQARGVPVRMGDLRSLIVHVDNGVVTKRIRRNVWESEGVEFDLAEDSELVEIGTTLPHLFGSDYDRRTTTSFHTHTAVRQRHCYRISRRVLEADLVLSVPKLKTHKKTGVTLNIKNMIGINTDKNYIPHYRVGSPSRGGDEFPDTDSRVQRLRRQLVRHAIDGVLGRLGRPGERMVHAFMTMWLALNRRRLERNAGSKLEPVDIFYRSFQGDRFRTGNWWGNDTCWRCALDINKLLLYGRADGGLTVERVRRYFSVIDGIVGGDEDGPMAPTPRREGVLVGGFDPVAVDMVATRIMGFSPDLIRDQRRGERLTRYALTRGDVPVRVYSNCPTWQPDVRPGADLGFRPHYGWATYLGNAV